MSRSTKKGFYVFAKLLKKAAAAKASGSKQMIKTWSRASTIVPDFLGLTFAVHNGNKFIPVLVTEDTLGHKFGEFAATRTFKGHAGQKKK